MMTDLLLAAIAVSAAAFAVSVAAFAVSAATFAAASPISRPFSKPISTRSDALDKRPWNCIATEQSVLLAPKFSGVKKKKKQRGLTAP